MIATRKSDGKRLAIEHTLIEPFIGEKIERLTLCLVRLALIDEGAEELDGS